MTKADNAVRDTAVHIEGLTKAYSGRVALSGVSVSVDRGCVVGILGPNGAGKTTLVEIIEGLRPFDAGTVSILGKDMTVSDRKLQARLGVVMQNTSLPPLARVGELLDLYASFYEEPMPPDQILASVGLTPSVKSLVRVLSAGQKKRLAIALAIIGRPELLVMDEPTADLDPQSRRAIWELIRNVVADRKRTVLLTTHHMDEAASICDEVIIIDQGAIIARGNPRALVKSHAPGVTALFKVDRPIDLREIAPAERIGQTTDAPRVRLHRDSVDEIIAVMTMIGRRFSAALTEVEIRENTLEQVFLNLTNLQTRSA